MSKGNIMSKKEDIEKKLMGEIDKLFAEIFELKTQIKMYKLLLESSVDMAAKSMCTLAGKNVTLQKKTQ